MLGASAGGGLGSARAQLPSPPSQQRAGGGGPRSRVYKSSPFALRGFIVISCLIFPDSHV